MISKERQEPDGLLNTINGNTQHIRNIVHNRSTESVVGTWLVQNLLNDYRPPGLSSPAKQILYLMGILVESTAPLTSFDFDDKDRTQTTEALEKAFNAYMGLYFPSEESLAQQSEQWYKVRQVAMSAFVNHFNQTLLITAEQASERIKAYLTKFDTQMSSDFGISASSALEIAWWIGNTLQECLDEFQEGSIEAVLRLGKVSYSDLVARFGAEGAIYWQLFTVGRGEGKPIDYPTERTIVEERPLIRVSDTVAMAFNVHLLFTSILIRGEECLADGSAREEFFRHRDKITEYQTAEAFKKVLGNDIELHRNLFETSASQNEHDLIILSDDICLLVEVKASPPVEPFRDPDRAYTRLKHAFRSDRGIQAAYDQAMRLRKLIEGNTEVVLYDRKGNEVLRLPNEILGRTFCVAVTRDNHGPLATFLSMLLQKSHDEPYPWSINLMDLQNIAEVWGYLKWDARQLKAFLSQRIKLHEKVFSHDELDYVGAFIKHCGLHRFTMLDSDLVHLAETYSDIFDQIHSHLFYGDSRVRINPINPFMSDLGESIRQGRAVFDSNSSGAPIKVGRNEECPCGSSVKFKRCHGK